MNVREFSVPSEFWAVAAPVVEGEPVLHSVMATVVDSLVREPSLHPDRVLYVVERAGGVPFLAHHTPPYPIHLPVGDKDAAVVLADHVHASGRRPTQVGGHLASVVAFAERWSELTGLRAEVRQRLGLYDLPVEPALPWPVHGHERLATMDDVRIVDDWSLAFYREAVGQEPPPGVTNHQPLSDGRLMFWCDPEPVAMAAATTSHGGVVRIGSVYTPPENRGHGYGSAATVAISRNRRAHGMACMLYTDLANPTSNGIYQAIGYRHLGDTADLAFVG